MRALGTRAQQEPGDADDPARRDALYAPGADGPRGGRHVRARGSGLRLQAQKRPGLAMALGLCAVAALALGGRAALRRR